MIATPPLPNDGRGTVITVGTFDGVHLGHRQVIEEIAIRGRRANRRSLLVTFEPHPLEIVNPPAAPSLLTLADERREYLAQCELDVVVFLGFSRELSQYSPEAFVRLLLDRFHLKELVIGHDHGFGRGRTGNVDLLRKLGEELGFAVDVVEEVGMGGRPVSSTLVRRAVAGGDLDMAAQLLGRPYSLTARVIRGVGRGRNMGYPTINLAIPDRRKLLPPDGVYAVRVEWAAGSSGAMMHQGPRPTFGETERSLEAHVFEVDHDLYGEEIKVSWRARLRDVMRFPSSEALKKQLDKDFAAAAALTG
ncbi:MAG: bifunctional riboflavin kinase/FAD synthetase [Gemmatimonadales bacterium]|nr:bifunctional riboflavin kinase/FAD synthetase [Gemmatimonadales bacterium]NIN50189.1 bifunctional riboflavin kinase/FAD synthetase [Gemmatimonadales bacterium]NIP07653.1 bifunctional riboflavin kinase/FAD synthetase [Gemmatimonadales bacterium]NIR01805.1 bifunctional riboflavin kinase/FAD synthetase [Gemmatimonadales bacterium]NIS65708.1 bifunctional riboflavin kinase/FAD synthetase [Gemmatimonadales bacterium]